MRKRFWAADWFTGLIFTIIFVLAARVIYADFFTGLETAAYDLGVRGKPATPSEEVAVIAIDDESIENIGRWPWTRDLHAEMVNRLREGGAKVVGNTIFYSEPQEDPGQLFIEDLIGFYDQSALALTVLAAEDNARREQQTGAGETGQAGEAEDAAGGGDGDRESGIERDGGAGEDDVGTEEGSESPTGSPTAAPTGSPTISELTPAHPLVEDLMELRQRLGEAEQQLATDQRLAESITASGNVILPMLFRLGEPRGRPDSDPPEWILEHALFEVTEGSGQWQPPVSAVEMIPPVEQLGRAAKGLGHLNVLSDVDGVQRYYPLVVDYYDIYFPSFALTVAAEALNLEAEDIQVRLGDGVRLGNLTIKTTPDLLMYNHFYGPRGDRPAFTVDSFFDVSTGRIPVSKYEGKVVLIGATAAGVGDSFPTPVSPNMAPVVSMAHTVSAILNEDFFTRPDWAGMAELATLLVLALYVIFVVPRMRAGLSALLSLFLLVGLLATEMVLLTGQSMWLQLTVPALFLFTGHMVMTVKLFRVTERLRFKSEEEGAESNKMLGLAFQGQGQLDMAFEKFRKCPFDESIADLLYNLALDYERKRQHNKAEAVYAYIHERLPEFKDVASRMKRAKSMGETVMLGGGGGHPGGSMVLEGDEVQKPMLGRYQVEKELGKGAMGVVYLGRDPKINRVVAIKTMALSDEFEEDEIEDVKERFFREAETAGRLNHPAIVTIYDAGEEHDLCYIAMEFLKGEDLTKHIKQGNLLDSKTAMELTATAAEALAVAHDLGVVHRDIKPANMMYDAESGNFKVTDFGIARITDSSKTKTGMVLGTPSYMSPEQLAGQKVDGRSDLFSLGVTLYQLLTGKLPFQADSMATLMYKIANEEHVPVASIRPELPDCVNQIIDKALVKDKEQRFQTGTEMARAIRDCAARTG